nr:unnamed protein product [Callosobruchus analis]
MSRFSSPDIITIMVIKDINGLANVDESGKITQKLSVKPISRPEYVTRVKKTKLYENCAAKSAQKHMLFRMGCHGTLSILRCGISFSKYSFSSSVMKGCVSGYENTMNK